VLDLKAEMQAAQRQVAFESLPDWALAFAQRRPARGVIFHSDRGCQYTSRDYAALARAHGVILSVSRKGESWDNAVTASFFATISARSSTTGPGPPEPGCTGKQTYSV
jgi:transposase InsO family protein